MQNKTQKKEKTKLLTLISFEFQLRREKRINNNKKEINVN
jgi:hypothetical protein